MRKLLTFLIALGAIVFGVLSPVNAACTLYQTTTGVITPLNCSGGVTVQWSASDKSSFITLSGSPLLTAKDVGGSGNDTVRADTSAASGGGKKWYFEIVANTVPSAPNPGSGFLGLANSSLSLTGSTCGGTNSVCLRDDGLFAINFASCANGVAWGSNADNVGLALRTDISPPKLWIRVNGGSWDGTTDDPVSNVGGCDVSGITFPLFPYFSATSFNYQVTAQFASASWSFTAPSGFTAWGN
jgi:hypothetical protein